MLYVRHELDADTSVEVPVLVKKGDAGTTTLAQNVEALPKERYRLEKYLIAEPADVDGDCIDDITELDDLGSQNPVSPAVAIELRDGTVAVPDKDTYDTLAATVLFKFVLFGMDTDRPGVYFMNTNTHPLHESFLEVAGLDAGDVEHEVVNGRLGYSEELDASDGSPGVYYFELKSVHPPLSIVNLSYTLLAASMPLLDDNLAFYIRNFDLPLFQSDLPLYRESRIDLVFDADIFADTSFLPLNPGEGYARPIPRKSMPTTNLPGPPEPRRQNSISRSQGSRPSVRSVSRTGPRSVSRRLTWPCWGGWGFQRERFPTGSRSRSISMTSS